MKSHTDIASQPQEIDIDWWQLDADFNTISEQFFASESAIINELTPLATPSTDQRRRILSVTLELIEIARETQHTLTIEGFLKEYRLDTNEGTAIMCLAEALIRIPDEQTRRQFIKDKLRKTDWQKHLGKSDSFWVNASTWGLMMSGKLLSSSTKTITSHIKSLFGKLGSPVIEKAILQAIEVISQQFVFSEDIAQAIKRISESTKSGKNVEKNQYTFSIDMLGEAALTEADAKRYFDSYMEAIQSLGKADSPPNRPRTKPSISVKLSALSPHYDWNKPKHLNRLYQKVLKIVEFAQLAGIALTFDAEESYRLETSLKIFKLVFMHPKFYRFPDIGLAVQAYQKRAYYVLLWLKALSEKTNKKIPVRLVKGAYWDTEIKWAQRESLEDYPVFTQKVHTDISYLACTRFLLENGKHFYPQLATHNAHSIASALIIAKDARVSQFEFQRLHGMGESIYDHLMQSSLSKKYASLESDRINCRVYAPVGSHEELLPYLVRRLLENGASTSFIHHLNNPKVLDADLAYEPADAFQRTKGNQHPNIPLPKNLYGTERENPSSVYFKSWTGYQYWENQLDQFTNNTWESQPSILDKNFFKQEPTKQFNPANLSQYLGDTYHASKETCHQAIQVAKNYQPRWSKLTVEKRAQLLTQTANEIEKERFLLIYLLISEAGKTWQSAQDEVREAIDYCRYYAQQSLENWQKPTPFPGPTGEENALIWEPRGLFCCISPWNFPLAIFVGQIAAALVTGNTVIAKPSGNTELTAYQAIACFYRAGVSKQALIYLPIKSAIFSQEVLTKSDISGVAFTGSNRSANQILITMSQRKNASFPHIIAETGGQNTMLVDSTSLPEQVVLDVVRSAFDSAGQRCSALRILFLQTDIADTMIEKIKGRMKLLTVGNPRKIDIDIGPIINLNARNQLLSHVKHLKATGHTIYQTPIDENCQLIEQGYFFPPTLIEIKHISALDQEMFGPILHVIRYEASQLDDVIDQINTSGFGLTLGIHSRIETRSQEIAAKIKVGNVYINRDIIGAQVGVQPFGGQGLSGTGPKAGGPNYLYGFSTEKTISINTTAIGGNTQLLSSSGIFNQSH